MTSTGPFRLINAVLAHDGPVRCVTLGPNNEIVTGCQSDAPTVRRWIENGDSWEEVGESILHDHWVTAATSLKPDISREFYTEGCIITGCQDSNIRVFNPDGVLQQTLQGHSKGVVSFSWTATNQLVSGSWDGTAKIWDLLTSTCIQTLGPHENGVQVLVLSNNLIATVSTGESLQGKPANFKLRFWDAETGQQVGNAIEDHQGSIRCLAPLPMIDGFATTSNDGTVMLRTSEGHVIDIMQHPVQEDGASPFVFNCCALDTAGGMDIVSCADDGSVLVWSGAELVQSIQHPCCVWAVKALSGGDFLTCGDDGFIRFFSQNPDLIHTTRVESLNNELMLSVLEMEKRKKTGPSSEEIAKAPRWEDRGGILGKSADQVMVFNKEGSLIAAQWISGSWVIVGTVTGTGDGGYMNETWFDHIMPVEIETPQGVMPLKLGYNNGENAFIAAQRFIDANSLQQGYLGQIADWITARSGQDQTPTLGNSGSSSTAANTTAPTTTTSMPVASVQRPYPYLITATLTYDDIPPMSKLLTKLTEFNSALNSDICAILADVEMGQIEQLARILSETSYYHSSRISEAQLEVLYKILLSWPTVQLFPVYDMLRVVAIHPHGAETLAGTVRTTLYTVLQHTFTLLSTATFTPTALTAMRFLCNCVKNTDLRTAIYTENTLVSILQCVHTHQNSENKQMRIVCSRIVYNVCGFTTTGSVFSNCSISTQCILMLFPLLNTFLNLEIESIEVLYNILCSVGTLQITINIKGSSTEHHNNILTSLRSVTEKWTKTQLDSTNSACLTETLALF